MGVRYTIKEETLEDLADSIRGLTHENLNMNPGQMADKIRSLRLGIPVDVKPVSHINPETGRWERPSDWPDLGSLTIEDDFDGVYLTYDLSKINDPWMCVFAQLDGSGGYYVDRGHIDNGSFVVDESHVQTHNSYYRQTLDNTNGNYQVFRITPNSANRHIIRYGFGPSEGSDTDTCLPNNYQPCVERIGRINYLGTIESSPDSRTSLVYSTGWLEHDHVECAGLRTVSNFSFARAWDNASSLQEVYVDWNTSNWVVSSLYRTFADCPMLENIIGINKWDTSGWNVRSNTGLYNTFYGCMSLRSAPIGGWDTHNWNPTSLYAMFTYCKNLREIDLSGWDVSNFRVTTMYILFSGCESLEKIDLHGWDTSEWEVTSLAYVFSNCKSLRYLDISGWDVSAWRPTTILSMFSNCQSLEELDLSSWDVSGWTTLTSIGGLFNMCHSLKHLKTGWDTSKWSITDFTGVFSNCCSLTEMDIGDWDVSNWRPTSLSNIFNSCASIAEVDLSNWDCSDWHVTNVNSFFAYAYNLRTVVLPDTLDLSAVTNVTDFFRNLKAVRDVNRLGVPLNMSYSALTYLTPQSLVGIINSLPTVTAARTLTLGANNTHKLTVEEIAVATQKGWTVA